MQVPYEFDASQPYVPHEYGQAKRPLYMLDHVENQVPSVLLLATRTLQDEELFLNYRLNPALAPYPDWYHQPNPEEAARRWAPHSFWSNPF